MRNFYFTVLFIVLACSLSTGCNGGSGGDGKSSGKAIFEFMFSASIPSNLSSGITSDISAQVEGNSIQVTVPSGTALSSIVASFTVSEKALVEVGSIKQENGVTSNDFTNPVVYTVKAEDGSIQSYTVTVKIAPDTFYGWGKAFGGEYQDSLLAFCTDKDGNAYLSLSSSDELPNRVIKINGDGTTAWTKEIEKDGTTTPVISKLEADSSGNIYAKANSFAGGTIIKYDSSGNEIWRRTLNPQESSTSNVTDITAMTINPSGIVYLAGRFSGSVDFDPGEAEDTKTAVSRCNEERCTFFNNYLTKINGDGSYGGTTVFDSLAEIRAIKSDSAGNIYLTGYVSDYYLSLWNSDYDPGPGLDQKNMFGGLDTILIKMNADGSYGWSKLMGGSGDDKSNDIAIDESGNIYITGEFEDQSDFNPDGGEDVRISTGDHDVFLTKINPNGSYSWTKTFAAGETALGKKVTVDETGNIYLSGYFWGSADFDPGQETDIKQSVGNSDIFLTRINKDGTYSWTRTFEPEVVTLDETGCLYLSAIPGGEIYLAGLFYSSMDLNPGNGKDMVTSNGYSDAFITRLHP